MKRIFALRHFRLLFIGCLLLFGLYQVDKNARVDDNALGENLYFLLKEGVIRSEMMRGYGGLSLEVHQTISHKLFLYLAYPFVALTGWSLLALHLFSILCFALLLLVLWKHFRFLIPYFPKTDRFFYGCLLLINYNVLYFSGTFRPEALLTLLGFLQFISLQQYLEKRSFAPLSLSAVLAGCALATHPHGAIFGAAGAVLLLMQKRWKVVPLYGITAALVFSGIYFADILWQGSFSLFQYQTTHDPVIGLGQKAWYSPLLSLADEHVRLFFNEREIVTTLLFVFAFLFAGRSLWRRMPLTVIYFLGSFLALGLLSYSNSPQYLYLYLPYMLAVIVAANSIVEASTHKAKKLFWRLLLAAYAGVHLFFALTHIFRNFSDLHKPSPAARNAAVARLLPQPHTQLRVLAYDDFVFNEIKHFQSIRSLTVYSFFREAAHLPPMRLPELLAAARRSEVDFILLDASYRERFGITDSLLRQYRSASLPNLYYHSPDYTLFRIR